MSMGVALMLDQSQLADPRIGLAQAHAELFSQAHQPLARPVEQLGVGREHHRLRLHRGVDHNTGEIGASVRVATARLSCNSALSLSAPIRWRQRVSDDRSNTNACWKNSSPQKYWKYGFSTQRSHRASSERS